MDVEAGVAQLGDLFGKQLDPLGGVAENDGLIDLQLQSEKREICLEETHDTNQVTKEGGGGWGERENEST